MAIKLGWMPPRSPFGLIQEDLFPAEWLILISCMMLNQTSRKQVERVLPEFIKRWPQPSVFVRANRNEVAEVCRSLGFANRRSENLMKMTWEYLASPWQHARELTGIGEYGARAWEIFCQGIIGDEVPNDHALTDYWRWFKQHQGVSNEQRQEDPGPSGHQTAAPATGQEADQLRHLSVA